MHTEPNYIINSSAVIFFIFYFFKSRRNSVFLQAELVASNGNVKLRAENDTEQQCAFSVFLSRDLFACRSRGEEGKNTEVTRRHTVCF